jgi:hypothetical protein
VPFTFRRDATANEIAGDEVVEVTAPKRIFREDEVLVGAQIVNPELLRPRLLAAGLGSKTRRLAPLHLSDTGTVFPNDCFDVAVIILVAKKNVCTGILCSVPFWPMMWLKVIKRRCRNYEGIKIQS